MWHLTSPQSASFAVTPNYEIVYFASDIHDVANIIDYRSGKEGSHTIMEKLELQGEENNLKQKQLIMKSDEKCV